MGKIKKEDLDFVAKTLDESSWLFYGDLDATFNDFLKKVFSEDLSDFGFRKIKMSDDFSTAYWLLISEFNTLGLVEYGTSPRGCWLTEEGERFKKIVMANEDAIAEANEYIHKKYSG